ncbi:MAG: DUF342 domain-containing protein [Lachnospiraceae bacterium]|nr:DUF342 domain-containing protein [Lachnospiraceae bacterium]
MENAVLEQLKKKGFMDIQLHQIQLGLSEGLAVEHYAKPEFDWFQMEEIRKGLKAKLDVKCYANPEISFEKMRQIRKGLQDGIDLMPYLEWNAGVLKEFRLAKGKGIDLLAYIHEGYDALQLAEIRKALEKNIVFTPHINREYRAASIAEICNGLESGVDVSVYAKEMYSWRKMRELRLGLENRLDVSKYSGEFYDWEQMREIRLGLKAGIEVDSYCSLRYSAKEMRKKRLELLLKTHVNGNAFVKQMEASVSNILSSEHALDVHHFPVKAENEDNVRTDDSKKPVLGKEHLALEFRAGNMEAYLTVEIPNGTIEHETLMDFLREKNIKKGILDTVLERICNSGYEAGPILIAQGKIPLKGEDGRYEYFFRTDVQKKPKVLEDGSTDYKDIEWFEVVREGQKIAYYHEAKEGIDGYDVLGNVIKGRKGTEKRVLRGKGFRLEEDKKTYTALYNGMIRLEDEELSVVNHLELDEINMTTGNIFFDGSLHIRGNVSSGMTVKATGDIVIDGNVEVAVIETEGSVMLKKGMNSSGLGTVKAGKNIVSRFFDATKVMADGNIEVEKCLNSQLYAKGIITSTKIFAGGVASSESGFYLNNVGNHAGLKTVLKVQINEAARNDYQNILFNIKDVARQLEVLSRTYGELMEKYSAQERSEMELFQKVENAVFLKQKQLDKMKELEKKLKRMIDKEKLVSIVIGGNAYEGTVIEMGSSRWEAKNQRNITVKQQNSDISVYNN